jgi:hypothetical protein
MILESRPGGICDQAASLYWSIASLGRINVPFNRVMMQHRCAGRLYYQMASLAVKCMFMVQA